LGKLDIVCTILLVLCIVPVAFGIYFFIHIIFALKKPVVVAYHGWIAFFNIFLAEGALNRCFQQFACAGSERLAGNVADRSTG
jgi:hypothetical protein